MRDPCRPRHRGARMAASRFGGHLGEASTDATSPTRDRERFATDQDTMGRDEGSAMVVR